MSRNKIITGSIGAALLIILGMSQNCSQVNFAESNGAPLQKSGGIPGGSGEESNSSATGMIDSPSDMPSNPGNPDNPNNPDRPKSNDNPNSNNPQMPKPPETVVTTEDPGKGPEVPEPTDEWLGANCDAQELKASPLPSTDFVASGAAVDDKHLNVQSLSLNDASSIRLLQINVADTLKIERSGSVDLNQIKADKIYIEANRIVKLQQLSGKELRIRTPLMSSNFHQSGIPRALVEAKSVTHDIHQIAALCLVTNSARTIHQVPSVHVLGKPVDNKKAELVRIHQVHDVIVEDANVGRIDQVSQVTLINTHVDKINQVGKLILINSTVDEMNQVGEVVH